MRRCLSKIELKYIKKEKVLYYSNCDVRRMGDRRRNTRTKGFGAI